MTRVSVASAHKRRENLKRRHARQRDNRVQLRMEQDNAIIQSMRYNEAATHALPFKPTLMRVRKAPCGFAQKLVDEDKSLSYADEVFNDFKRIEGTHSGLIYCVERESNKVVLVVKIVLFQDMSAHARLKYNWMFEYIEKDKPYRSLITTNSAMVEGRMKASGYRVGMETNYDYGTYTTSQLKRLRNNPRLLAIYQHHLAQATHLHRLMSQSLYALSPKLLEERVEDARARRLPLFGYSYDDQEDCGTEISETTPFTPHIIYTFGGFANKPHCDNDVNLWTTGIWGPVNNEGTLFTRGQGFHQEGYAFYVASHRVLVDIGKIDGVVEIAWRSTKDVHGTTKGVMGK